MELEKARNVSKKQTTPSFTTPVATEFFMIDASEEMNAKENAWSIENMPGHKAENRTTKYIGSHFEGFMDLDTKDIRRYFDYFVDSAGEYWYGVRVMLPSGELVSMEEYLFGGKVKNEEEKTNESE